MGVGLLELKSKKHNPDKRDVQNAKQLTDSFVLYFLLFPLHYIYACFTTHFVDYSLKTLLLWLNLNKY